MWFEGLGEICLLKGLDPNESDDDSFMIDPLTSVLHHLEALSKFH